MGDGARRRHRAHLRRQETITRGGEFERARYRADARRTRRNRSRAPQRQYGWHALSGTAHERIKSVSERSKPGYTCREVRRTSTWVEKTGIFISSQSAALPRYSTECGIGPCVP